MRRVFLLLGVVLMADFLGGTGGVGDEGESVDFLGRTIPLAFKSEPALPAGAGPAPGVAAAPSTIGGAGTAPGASVASAGGSAGSQGPSTLAQIAQALGLATKTGEAASRLGQGSRPGAPTGEFGDFLTRSGLTPEEFDALLQFLPPGWTEGQDIPGLDELRFAPPPEIPDVGAGPAPVGGDPGAPGIGPGAAGLAGSGLGLLSLLSGNRDVGRAGQGLSTAANLYGLGSSLGGAAGTAPTAGAAATGAGASAGEAAAAGAAAGEVAPSLAAGLSGAGFAFAPAALGFAGMSIADQVETEARVKRDVANAKNVLGAKVPSAVSRLGKTLNDLSSLDPASATTEQLLAAQQSLQAARQEFNAVDHAFKGALTIAGKPVDTGLSLDMVKPQLDALNESQLRIQDALESRGLQSGQIPGYQSPQDWLNFLDSPLYQQYTTGTPRFSEGVEFEPADLQNPEIAAALKGIQPGQTEAGLRQLIARGLPARVPRPAPEALVPRAFGGGEDFAPVMSAIDAP